MSIFSGLRKSQWADAAAGTAGGHAVEVEGSFDNWATRHPLQRSGKDFTLVKLLPPGVYQVCQQSFDILLLLRYGPSDKLTLNLNFLMRISHILQQVNNTYRLSSTF